MLRSAYPNYCSNPITHPGYDNSSVMIAAGSAGPSRKSMGRRGIKSRPIKGFKLGNRESEAGRSKASNFATDRSNKRIRSCTQVGKPTESTRQGAVVGLNWGVRAHQLLGPWPEPPNPPSRCCIVENRTSLPPPLDTAGSRNRRGIM